MNCTRAPFFQKGHLVPNRKRHCRLWKDPSHQDKGDDSEKLCIYLQCQFFLSRQVDSDHASKMPLTAWAWWLIWPYHLLSTLCRPALELNSVITWGFSLLTNARTSQWLNTHCEQQCPSLLMPTDLNECVVFVTEHDGMFIASLYHAVHLCRSICICYNFQLIL